jgi:hypothetical protein
VAHERDRGRRRRRLRSHPSTTGERPRSGKSDDGARGAAILLHASRVRAQRPGFHIRRSRCAENGRKERRGSTAMLYHERMMWFPAMVAAHAVLTTTGYVGLIAINAWLATLCRNADAAVVLAGVHAWRRLVRVFGPLAGLGVIAGFALAAKMGMPLTAGWLVATYGLIVVALGVQGAMMAPWQLRAQAAAASGAALSTRPVVVTVWVFTLSYIAILTLMLWRP